MGPIIAGLFAAASLATSVISARGQAKAQGINNQLQISQALLQSAEAAFERTKAFRQNAAANLALQGAGFGSALNFAGTAQESFANYIADISSLTKQANFAVITGQTNEAQIKSQKFTTIANGVIGAATLAKDLGLFSSSTPKVAKGAKPPSPSKPPAPSKPRSPY